MSQGGMVKAALYDACTYFGLQRHIESKRNQWHSAIYYPAYAIAVLVSFLANLICLVPRFLYNVTLGRTHLTQPSTNLAAPRTKENGAKLTDASEKDVIADPPCDSPESTHIDSKEWLETSAVLRGQFLERFKARYESPQAVAGHFLAFYNHVKTLFPALDEDTCFFRDLNPNDSFCDLVA